MTGAGAAGAPGAAERVRREGGAPLEETLAGLVRRCLGAELRRSVGIPAGLSGRRFFRLFLSGGATAVARVEGPPPPGRSPEPPLAPLHRDLERGGLPVPKRYGGDARAGIDLLEDLGERSLQRIARDSSPGLLRAIYLEACQLPPRLQRLAPSGGGGSPPAAFQRRFDRALLANKERAFLAHSVPTRLGRPPRPAERDVVRDAFAAVAAAVAAAPLRLAHRDFQSSNLLAAPRGGGQRLVMIDYQGALLAPPEYDLVCLLRDSYVELPAALWRELAETARRALPEPPDPRTFADRFDLLTVARKAKDHAFFTAAAERGTAAFSPTWPPPGAIWSRPPGAWRGRDRAGSDSPPCSPRGTRGPLGAGDDPGRGPRRAVAAPLDPAAQARHAGARGPAAGLLAGLAAQPGDRPGGPEPPSPARGGARRGPALVAAGDDLPLLGGSGAAGYGRRHAPLSALPARQRPRGGAGGRHADRLSPRPARGAARRGPPPRHLAAAR